MRGHKADLWKVFVLLPLMISFLLGSACGALMYEKLGRMSIVLNIAFYSTIGVVYSLYIALSLKVPVILAVLKDNSARGRITNTHGAQTTKYESNLEYAENSLDDNVCAEMVEV